MSRFGSFNTDINRQVLKFLEPRDVASLTRVNKELHEDSKEIALINAKNEAKKKKLVRSFLALFITQQEFNRLDLNISWLEFARHNEACINKIIREGDIEIYTNMLDLLKKRKFSVTDLENGMNMVAEKVYFDLEGRLSFTSLR